MIIWGSRTIKRTPDAGQFHCPHCSSQQPYKHEKFGRWFTLYFIPVIPLGSVGEQITCSTCAKSWNMTVLANDPQKIKAAQLNRIAGDWISVMAAVAVSRGGPTQELAQLIVAELEAAGVQKMPPAAVYEAAAGLSSPVPDATIVGRLGSLPSDLSTSGKELFLVSTLKVLQRLTNCGPAEISLISLIAQSLGVSAAHVKGILLGAGLTKDLEEAKRQYAKAAAQGNEGAKSSLQRLSTGVSGSAATKPQQEPTVPAAEPFDGALREIDFNALPLEVRQRLVTVLKSLESSDGPIIREVQGLTKPILKLGSLILLGICVIWLLLSLHFGQLGESDAWQYPGFAIVYCLLTAFVLYAVLALWRQVRLRTVLPFPPGRYLFPLDLVDAQTRVLKIYPLAMYKNLAAVHQHDKGNYEHTTFTFSSSESLAEQSVTITVKGQKAAEQAFGQFQARQAEVRLASQGSDAVALARLDPFFKLRVADWKINEVAEESGPSKARHLPAFFRWRAAIAVVGGVIIAVPLWIGRNLLSDAAQYKQALSMGTERAYVDYLAGGWSHVAEVHAALPRIAFNEAKRAGTVTALKGVLVRYKDAGLEGDVKQEIQAVYAAALARFREQAATSDPTLVPFMERLLSSLRDAGTPDLQIRFTRPDTDSLVQADARLAQLAKNGGREMAPAARHFGSDSAAPREARIVTEMARGFKVIFPSDILSLAAPNVANSRLPVINIAYKIAPSGTTYVNEESKRLFVGVIVNFDVRMSLPDSSSDRHIKFDVLPPVRFTVTTKVPRGALKGVAPDEQVYVVMAERAFDQLGVELRSAFFSPDSDAYKQSARR